MMPIVTQYCNSSLNKANRIQQFSPPPCIIYCHCIWQLLSPQTMHNDGCLGLLADCSSSRWQTVPSAHTAPAVNMNKCIYHHVGLLVSGDPWGPEVHNVITLSSEKDQATAIGNTYKIFCEIWTCGFWEMWGYRQTKTKRDTLVLLQCKFSCNFIN